MESRRVWISGGRLIDVRNAVVAARPLFQYDGCPPVDVALEFQLFRVPEDVPATGEYRGLATFVARDGKQFVLLGELTGAQLNEYRLAQEATAESLRVYDETVAGVQAAIGDFQPARRTSAKGADWLRGYDVALAYRRSLAR